MRRKNGCESTDFQFEVICSEEVNVREQLGGEMVLPTEDESKLRKGYVLEKVDKQQSSQGPRLRDYPVSKPRETGKQTTT